MKDTALIIIDIQNDYFPGGKMELDRAELACDNAVRVLDNFREKQSPVFHVQHESVSEGSSFFLPNTRGQKIHDRVAPMSGETVIQKNYPNSFVGTDLFDQLKAKKINHLVITGMMTFMCVDATSRAAKDLGFGCTLIHDATAARDLEFDGISVPAVQVKAAFLAALSMVCDQVVTTAAFLDQASL